MNTLRRLAALALFALCLTLSAWARAATFFWVGGTGTWNGSASAHFSATSGGSGGAGVPTSTDPVVIDGNSGGGTVTVGVSGVACASLDTTGYTGTFAGSTAFTISGGSLTWGSSLAGLTYSGTITMADTSGTTRSVTSNGKQTVCSLTFDGVGGVFQFGDAFNSTKPITLTNGTLNQNGKTVTSQTLSSNNSNTRVLTNDAAWTLTGSGVATILDFTTTTGLTFTATTAGSFVIAGTNATNHTIQSGGQTFNDLSWAGSGAGTLTVSGGTPTFRDLSVSNTGASTLTLSAVTVFRSIDFTGFNGTFAGSNNISVSGNVTLGSGMTYSSTSLVTTTATSGTQTITCNTKSFNGQLKLNGAGGTVALADDCGFTNATSLSFVAGTFNTNNHGITASGTISLSSSTTRDIHLGSSLVTLTGTGTQWAPGTITNLTFDAGTSTIALTNASATGKTFAAAALNYYKVQFGGAGSGTFTITSSGGGSTWHQLDIAGGAHSVVFPSGTTQTFDSTGPGITTVGTSGNVATFTSSNPGTSYTWSKAGGWMAFDYASITDCTVAGGARFFVGSHSTASNPHGLRLTNLALAPVINVDGCGTSGNATHVRVMAIGDSYTSGQASNGWRLMLNNLVAADHITGSLPSPYVIDWIGPKNSGSGPSNHHDGIDGSGTQDHVNGGNLFVPSNPATAISALLGAGNPYSPDVVIVMIGHNNQSNNNSTNGFQNATIGWLPMVTAIHTQLPNVRFVFTLVGGKTSGTYDTMNNYLTATGFPAATAAGWSYETADVYTGFDQVNDFAADGHWTTSGYTRAAAAMHEALRRQIVRAVGGTPDLVAANDVSPWDLCAVISLDEQRVRRRKRRRKSERRAA